MQEDNCAFLRILHICQLYTLLLRDNMIGCTVSNRMDTSDTRFCLHTKLCSHVACTEEFAAVRDDASFQAAHSQTEDYVIQSAAPIAIGFSTVQIRF